MSTLFQLRAHADGKPVPGWRFKLTTAIVVCDGPRRTVVGWSLFDPDGVERFCEGTWKDFVPFANTVLENYGISTRIS